MSAAVRKIPSGQARVVYHEPARGYAASVLLLVVLVAGFVSDLALGGGRSHLVAWLAAIVVVVGIDVLTVRTARNLRSLTVTEDEVQVGEQTLPRREIVGFEQDFDVTARVLGRAPGEGLPRGTGGLGVHLADGTVWVVPTRHADRLTRALELSWTVPGIRLAEPEDTAAVLEVQERALTLFSVSGYLVPPGGGSVDALHEAKAVLVAGRRPVGAVQIHELDGLAHIKQLSVLPGRMRQGVGTALLDAACSWAEAHGYPAVTAIAFADVPWSRSFYAGRGFVELAELTPGLAELRDWERSAGMDDVGRRVVMRRELCPRESDAAAAE